jgi:predicted RNase H-like HicB family nuclease
MATLTFTAVLHREGNLYVAECPEVGTVSQGPTVEEALANLREATELYLEEFPLSEGGEAADHYFRRRGPWLGFVQSPAERLYKRWSAWDSCRFDSEAATLFHGSLLQQVR